MNTFTKIQEPQHLTIRRLLIDWKQPLDRHWNGGDAFRTAFANALSMSFPVGEQFFIDAIKPALPMLRELPGSEGLVQEAKNFIGQEGTHRFIHAQFNDRLVQQGYRNRWEGRAKRHIELLHREMARRRVSQPHLHELAVTCAVEHLTAIMGDSVMDLKDTPHDWFAQAQEPARTMWYWHSAEESEHKSLAFDVYTALGGGRELRLFYYKRMLVFFTLDLTLQVLDNLWRDGSWRRWDTWKQAARFLLGSKGLLPMAIPSLWEYRREGFHPNQLGQPEPAQSWLTENQHAWAAVKQAPAD